MMEECSLNYFKKMESKKGGDEAHIRRRMFFPFWHEKYKKKLWVVKSLLFHHWAAQPVIKVTTKENRRMTDCCL